MVERLGKIAYPIFQLHGVPASVLVAQAIREGLRNNWSLTPAAENLNNWFGIPPRCVSGYFEYDFESPRLQQQEMEANLRSFRSLPECMETHAELIAKFYPRSMGCVAKPRLRNDDVQAFVFLLEGYSASKYYSDDLLALMEKWQLRRFDKKLQEKKAS